MRVTQGTDAPSGDFEAPAWGTTVSQVALSGDSEAQTGTWLQLLSGADLSPLWRAFEPRA